MKFRNEAASLVFVGKWNKFILNPSWVGDFLFEAKKIETLISLEQLAPVKYTMDNFILLVDESKVNFVLKEFNRDDWKLLEEKASKLISTLKYTPIIGFGINFGFQLEESDDRILFNELFSFKDEPLISAWDYNTSSRTIARSLIKDRVVLNSRIKWSDNDQIELDFNFHHSTTSADECAGLINGDLGLSYFDELKTNIETSYKIEYHDVH